MVFQLYHEGRNPNSPLRQIPDLVPAAPIIRGIQSIFQIGRTDKRKTPREYLHLSMFKR